MKEEEESVVVAFEHCEHQLVLQFVGHHLVVRISCKCLGHTEAVGLINVALRHVVDEVFKRFLLKNRIDFKDELLDFADAVRYNLLHGGFPLQSTDVACDRGECQYSNAFKKNDEDFL